MPVIHEINLNLSKYILPATVHMMQGDTDSRTVVATIWDGPVKYTPAEGVKPVVRFGKPDGTGGLYNKTETDEKVVLSGSKVTAPIARQVLTVPGIVKMQIELYEGDTKISAFPFQIHVIASSKDDAEEISKNYANFSINYEILGRYTSLSELTTAHPTGEAGDAWFVGTESENVVYQWDVDKGEWVNVGSLKGPAGAAGKDGKDGAAGSPGTNGKDGVDGTTPHIGDNGNWYIGDDDTGKPSRGVAGANGKDGVDGKDGTPGKDGADGAPGKDGAAGSPGIVISSTEPTDPSHPVWIDPDGDASDGILTDAEKQEIVEMTLAALPTWEGGSY